MFSPLIKFVLLAEEQAHSRAHILLVSPTSPRRYDLPSGSCS